MTAKQNLDARPDRIDLRDIAYSPPLRSLAPMYPHADVVDKAFQLYVTHGMVLDQGGEGACTGFGLAATINSLVWQRAILKGVSVDDLTIDPDAEAPEKVSMRMLYHLARFYDEWPGENYDGSSCRGAVKAWFKHGVCSDRVWPYINKRGDIAFVDPKVDWQQDAAERPLGVYYRVEKDSITDMQAAIQEVGAIFCSASVHSGWDLGTSRGEISHDKLVAINWKTGEPHIGGHAFAIVGYNERGFVVQNSWGTKWGHSGFALLSYADWVANGDDAWVCVLGAKMRSVVPDYYFSGALGFSESSTLLGSSAKSSPRTRAKSPMVIWGAGEAYQHSVVMGNEGRVINRLVDRATGDQAVRRVLLDNASEYFAARPNSTPRLAIYAHGGLNSEKYSQERVAKLGPYFEANGIFPVFLCWRTGYIETAGGILGDLFEKIAPRKEGIGDWFDSIKDGLKEAADRSLEIACHNAGPRAMWSEMRQNAEASMTRGAGDRGCYLVVQMLAKLKKDFPTLEVHVVGHSAGAIMLGHMMEGFTRRNIKIGSCTLYAPACGLDFALRTYRKAVESKNKTLSLNDLYIHVLSDERELADTVGPYGKSLLYLISRALEDEHKKPLLGLSKSFDKNCLKPTDKGKPHWNEACLEEVKNWQTFWGKRNKQLFVLSEKEVSVNAHWKNGKVIKRIKSIESAHGSFDNDVEVIDATLRRMLGKQLSAPITSLDY